MNSFALNYSQKEGYTGIPGNACGYSHIDEFGILNVTGKTIYANNTRDRELGIMILSGKGTITINNESFNIGNRENVFSGLPQAAYIPPKHTFSLSGNGLTAAFCYSKAKTTGVPRIIRESDIMVAIVGKDNWAREVRTVIPPKGFSENLIMGETINFPGNWSGTPPHKHENDNVPVESLHEELYFFKTQKVSDWGIQRTYSPEREVHELIPLTDNTITLIPWGYHQIVAGPGCMLYYLFFLAGKGNTLCGFVDPEQKWLLD